MHCYQKEVMVASGYSIALLKVTLIRSNLLLDIAKSWHMHKLNCNLDALLPTINPSSFDAV